MKIFLIRNFISIIILAILVIVLDFFNLLNIPIIILLYIIEILVMSIGAYKKVYKPIEEMIKLVENTDWESDKIDFDKFDKIEENTFSFDLHIFIRKYKYLIDLIEKKTSVVHDLNYLSEHDELTGCYNRVKLEKKKDFYESLQEITIIYLDINNLKLMNDTFGHEAGDILLKRASKKLGYWLNYGDIYRMGGDEFMIVIPNKKIEKIMDLMKGWYDNIGVLNRAEDKFKCDFSYGIARSEDVV